MDGERGNYAYRLKMKRKKRIRRRVVTSSIILAVVLIVFIIYRIMNIQYADYSIVKRMERDDSGTVGYVGNSNQIIRYGKDGASSFRISDGIKNWLLDFKMKDPYVDICGTYSVITDIGSKILYMNNGSGSMERLEVSSPILGVKVSEQGIAAIMMETKDGYLFELHNLYSQGDTLLHTFTSKASTGFIVDFDLSADAQTMVVSYITVNNGLTTSHVTFYKFNNGTDNYFASSFVYGQYIIPKVVFLNGNTACALGDKKFLLFSTTQKPDIRYNPETEYEMEARSVFYSEKYVGVIFDNYEVDQKYKLYLYNLLGEVVLEQTFNYDYNEVQVEGEEIIFRSEREITIMKTNGKLKFHKVFDDSIYYFTQGSKKNQYYLINNMNIELIKLKEKGGEE